MLDFITWTADPAIFSIGSREIRWYGLAFAIGFLIGYKIVEKMWKREKLNPAWIDSLLIYTMLGTVIGARLGHCLFYAPDYYLANPLEILKVWEGGLASHGGTLGIIIEYTDIRQICPGGFVLLKTCMLGKEEQLPFLPLPVILHNFMKPPAIW